MSAIGVFGGRWRLCLSMLQPLLHFDRCCLTIPHHSLPPSSPCPQRWLQYNRKQAYSSEFRHVSQPFARMCRVFVIRCIPSIFNVLPTLHPYAFLLGLMRKSNMLVFSAAVIRNFVMMLTPKTWTKKCSLPCRARAASVSTCLLFRSACLLARPDLCN